MDIYDLRYNVDSSSFLTDYGNFKIYAHENELLHDHILKTLHIFSCLIDEDVVLNFYNDFLKKGYINISYNEFKEIIHNFVCFHDIGKLSFNFQINRLNKNNFSIKEEQKNILNKNHLNNYIDMLEWKHSFSGALIFISKYKDLFNENKLFILVLAYSIYSHHTYLKDLLFEEGFIYNHFRGNEKDKEYNTLYCLLLFLNIASYNQIYDGEFSTSIFQKMQNDGVNIKDSQDSVFSFFYNYIYSLLISADVLASKEYEKSFDDVEKVDFDNRIDSNLKDKMVKSFYNVKYNQDLDSVQYEYDVKYIDDINLLRRNMLLEASNNLKNHLDSHVFFLNIPTGGGKTNTSMKLALDLIDDSSVNRIIYAMPFINIIEQNYNVIKDNFSLSEDCGEIRKIYSATETIFDEKDDEFKSKIILKDSFFNYPVICTTFSTFFDGIINNKKRYKYKISALANSVVILDEIQSLPLVNWNSLYFLITEMAEKYNIYFIIMSATLPQFDKLKLDYNNNLNHISANSLIVRPEHYFNHFIFDRTEIKGKIMDLSIDDELVIKDYLLNKIIKPNFEEGYTKGLIVLNTINSSKFIYDLLCDCSDGFEVDLLNSSLLSNVKQEIIYKINNMGIDNSRYILVSTQSIEAGVDVSFDFVIRDFSILDSIEQIRGRCNRSRELNKDGSNRKGRVYLINLKNNRKYLHEYIYDTPEINSRILETKKVLKKNLDYNYKDILEYYDNVSKNINNLEDKKEDNFLFNDRDNIKNWNNLEYSKLQDKNDGIHIINNQLNQYSVFVPIKMKIFFGLNNIFNFEEYNMLDLKEFHENNKDNFIFSFNELKFLKDKQKYSSHVFIENNLINGCELIKFYMEFINNFIKFDFNGVKIIEKEFSSILNKFIINISINNEEIEQKLDSFKKFGYFRILPIEYIGDDEYALYSEKRGFNYHPEIVEIS